MFCITAAIIVAITFSILIHTTPQPLEELLGAHPPEARTIQGSVCAERSPQARGFGSESELGHKSEAPNGPQK